MTTDAQAALYERIYTAVQQIPAGAVSTYGDIAAVVGGGCEGRLVGEALGALPTHRQAVVPWQRVINRAGEITTRGLLQRDMLLTEQVPFDDEGRVILARCRWGGPPAEWAAANGFHPLPPRQDAEQLRLL